MQFGGCLSRVDADVMEMGCSDKAAALFLFWLEVVFLVALRVEVGRAGGLLRFE